ncbi:type II secretion system protein [Idiomarina sp. ST20R2A10]|uniref:type II secretion system protein n=1 Tax=unclassified Idiomarina TaxID=2614829 RepID=UPI000304FBC4|nr:prepilin-type N-terminal cleavage/methylation domain-containing protein [Idiomarina sp. 28-8]NWO01727.1 prepilin-type N-terminal cleavage/methylation domain-containing protein [Idiomarinaceae bacterium]
MRNQKGFTLIELIIVIVVLGILAVTAAPQFINFSSDARTSSLKGMEGSIKGAMQLTYSKAAVEGKESAASGETISVKGSTVGLVYGYPAASESGIINAVDGDFADSALTNDWVYEVGTDTVVVAQSSSIGGDTYSEGDVEASECYLTYTAASSDGEEPPVISSASVTVTDSGC